GLGPGDSGQYGTGDSGWYAGHQPGYGSPSGDAPSWPSSALPPSFGQRPVAGERPDFDDTGPPPAGPPPAGPAHAGPQPLASQPGPAGYGLVEPGFPEPGPAGYGVVGGPAQPAPTGYGSDGYGPAQTGPAGAGTPESGWPGSPAPDVPQARSWDSTEAAVGPWETYETETRYEPAVGYGVVPGPEPARADNGAVETGGRPGADGGTYGSYGVVPPVAEPSPGYPEEPT